MTYDLAIIGGGPAATAAGIYAARKRLKTILIADKFGGQSDVSEKIENWVGTPEISGAELAKNLEKHLRAYAGDIVEIKIGERCANVGKTSGGFEIATKKGKYQARAVLVASGSRRKKLQALNAEKFEHKGITYCATCDGPLFSGMDVAVIGGGNAGFESAAQLLSYAKTVVLLHKHDEFKADPSTVKKVLSNPKMHAILNAEILEITGDKFASGIIYKDKETGEKKEIAVQGIFVEIGSTPNTEFVSHLVKLTPYGQIIADPRTQKTSMDGIWSAGDCADGLYHQNNIAAGDAVKALENIYMWLHHGK